MKNPEVMKLLKGGSVVCLATAAILVAGSIAHDIWVCVKKDGDVNKLL